MILMSSNKQASIEIAAIIPFFGSMFWRVKDVVAKEALAIKRQKLIQKHDEGDIYSAVLYFRLWNEISKAHMLDEKLKYKDSRKAASAWCRENGFFEKSMQSAESLRIDLLRQFMVDETDGQLPTQQETMKMIRSCQFLHVALRVNKNSFVDLLSGTVGIVPTVASNISCVFYHEYGRSKFSGHTVASIEDIKAECQILYELAVEKNRILPNQTVDVDCLSEAVLKKLIGKDKSLIRDYEDETKSFVVYSMQKGTISVQCSIGSVDKCRDLIDKRIALAKISISTVTDVFAHLGQTRVVLASGGLCTEILHANEFCTLKILGLNSSIEYAKLFAFLSKHGSISNLSIDKSHSQVFCLVEYKKKECAARALLSLNGEIYEGASLTVKSSEKQLPGVTGDLTCSFKIAFPIGPATGRVRIFLSTALDVEQAAAFVHIFPGAVRNMPKIHDIESTSKDSGKKFVLYMKNCNRSWNEKHYYKTFSLANIVVIDVRIERTAAEDSRPLNVVVAELLQPLSQTELAMTAGTQFDDPVHQMSGFYISLNLKPSECEERCKTKYDDANIQRYEQSIQAELEFTLRCSIHAKVYQIASVKAQLSTLIDYARSCQVFVDGDKSTKGDKSKQGDLKTMIRFKSNSYATLKKIQGMTRFATSPLQYIAINSGILFTHFGRAKMELISHTSYIHWDIKTKSIFVYGSEEERREGFRLLDLLIEELADRSHERLFTINRFNFKKLSKPDIAAVVERIQGIKDIVSFEMYKNVSFTAIGSMLSLAEAEASLKQSNLLHKNQHEPCDKYCYICMCDDDSAFMKLSLCGHGVHYECIEGYFSGPPPYTCQYEGCKSLIALDDIKLFCDPESMSKINDQALVQYLKANLDKYYLCVQPGCNQVMQHSDLVNNVGYCDTCARSYCISCSNRLYEPIEEHKKYSCLEMQTDVSFSKIAILSDELLLNKIACKCPHCAAPFFEYDNCTSLTCSTCNKQFCATCLVFKGDAHGHAFQCLMNPLKRLFITTEEYLIIQSVWRSAKTQEFFDSLGSKRLKEGLMESVGKELDRMHITRPSILE